MDTIIWLLILLLLGYLIYKKRNKNISLIQHKKKYSGQIGYFKLSDWWDNSFTQEERDYINSKFYSTNVTTGTTIKTWIDKGNSDYGNIKTQQGPYNVIIFLFQTGTYFVDKEHQYIARRFFDKALSFVTPNTHPVTKHFLYLYIVSKAGYDDTIRRKYALEMINIEPEVRKDFKQDRHHVKHAGYNTIIELLVKEDKYDEAIQYCNEVIQKQWGGNFKEIRKALKANKPKQEILQLLYT